jgi:hypothetical protein
MTSYGPFNRNYLHSSFLAIDPLLSVHIFLKCKPNIGNILHSEILKDFWDNKNPSIVVMSSIYKSFHIYVLSLGAMGFFNESSFHIFVIGT